MKLHIRGMSCQHCVRAVTQALEGVAGVDRVVEVSLDRGEAILEGTPDPSAVIAAVTEEGYEASVG